MRRTRATCGRRPSAPANAATMPFVFDPPDSIVKAVICPYFESSSLLSFFKNVRVSLVGRDIMKRTTRSTDGTRPAS
jgi:hypothetical protein